MVKSTFETSAEEVKYGGILFTSGVQFALVFSYKAHVTVEFGSGSKITDTFGFLEVTGSRCNRVERTRDEAMEAPPYEEDQVFNTPRKVSALKGLAI